MGTRRRIGSFFAMTAGLAMVIGAAGIPAPAAAATSCRAKDVTKGTAWRQNLQRLLDHASRGDTIAVKGVCVGSFQIDTRLTLVGRSTKATPKPILRNKLAGNATLGIAAKARVHVSNVRISGGEFGGIYNYGTVVLGAGVVVRGNTANVAGGGIANYGTATLTKDATVAGNAALTGGGGGILNVGTLTLRGSAAVTDNTAVTWGGGIDITSTGVVTMEGSATVTGNRSDSDNAGGETGGGIFQSCTGQLNGAVDGGNVYLNFIGTTDTTEDNISHIC